MKCIHDLPEGTCSFCNGTVTAKNQTRTYGPKYWNTEDDDDCPKGPMKYQRDTRQEDIELEDKRKLVMTTSKICRYGGCDELAMTWSKNPNRVVSGYCKPHHAMVAGRKKRKKDESEMKMTTDSEKKESPKNVSPFVIPIQDYPEVEEALEKAARIHIRSIKMQALAYIVQGLQKDDHLNMDIIP